MSEKIKIKNEKQKKIYSLNISFSFILSHFMCTKIRKKKNTKLSTNSHCTKPVRQWEQFLSKNQPDESVTSLCLCVCLSAFIYNLLFGGWIKQKKKTTTKKTDRKKMQYIFLFSMSAQAVYVCVIFVWIWVGQQQSTVYHAIEWNRNTLCRGTCTHTFTHSIKSSPTHLHCTTKEKQKTKKDILCARNTFFFRFSSFQSHRI